MTIGLVRERLGFSRAEFEALPWHDARGYLDYLRDTADRAAGRDPDQQTDPGPAPPRVEEPEPLPPGPRLVDDYDPADDDGLPPPLVEPLRWDDTPTPAAPPARPERASWVPTLPVKTVAGFGDQ
jgi:hypothetical protein